nr:protein archease isoform X4 [Vulpes vulpes]
MKGGSRVSSAAIMAQEEEDIRDYNLTEEQKAIKAKYPPAIRKYEYLDHTADVQLHAWGDTLEEAFEQCAMAMFGYMTDTGTVEPLQTVEVETQGDDLQSLLFHFLDEWLYKFSADEFFIPREVKVGRRIFIVQAPSDSVFAALCGFILYQLNLRKRGRHIFFFL